MDSLKPLEHLSNMVLRCLRVSSIEPGHFARTMYIFAVHSGENIFLRNRFPFRVELKKIFDGEFLFFIVKTIGIQQAQQIFEVK